MKLTDRQIDRAKAPPEKDVYLNDGRGLYLRIHKSTNVKSWVYRYEFGGSNRWLLIGPYPIVSLADARVKANDLRDMRKRGLDPEAELKRAAQSMTAARQAEEEKERAENLTVKDLFDAWIEDGVARKDDNAELKRSFEKDILPPLGSIPVRLLTEQDVRKALRDVVRRGVNRTAVLLYVNLKQMLGWGEQRKPWRKLLVDGNPLDLIEIDRVVDKDYDLDNVRERILTRDEIIELRDKIAAMRQAYEDSPDKRRGPYPLARTTELSIWIMLSTLCRVGELTMAKWEHVDFEAREWIVPRENVKGAVAALAVYLSDFALSQFKQLHEITGKTKWLFPAPGGENHIYIKSITKQIGDRQASLNDDAKPRKKRTTASDALVLSDGKNGNWVPHDLRRTGATIMQSLGVDLNTIDRCQNHVLHGSKVRRHYMLHEYRREKEEAWRLLGERLDLILNGPTNVVPFVRAS